MGYYIRVFARSDATVSAAALRAGFADLGWDAVVECDPGTDDHWEALRVAHPDGSDICFIQRDDVTAGSLGRSEVDDFAAALADYAPPSGAAWVGEFLDKVRVVYAVKVQTEADADPAGWDVLQYVVDTLAAELDGITHAELEGFYIDDGTYLVAAAAGFERLSAVDEWTVAVRSGDGWTGFTLNPDDEAEVSAFRRGEVPAGVESWAVT